MPTLYTVGHGTLGADELAALLHAAGVDQVVDVRRYPGSRRHPRFGRDAMTEWLPEAGVGYRWVEALGGRRPPASDSVNTSLRNRGFRGYADYMRSPEFAHALRDLLADAADTSTAVLCAESLWWRCHRRLIADACVLAHEWAVRHLDHSGRLHEHALTDGVRRDGAVLLYAAAGQPTLLSESDESD